MTVATINTTASLATKYGLSIGARLRRHRKVLIGIALASAIVCIWAVFALIVIALSSTEAGAWPWSDIPWFGPALDWAIGGSDPISDLIAIPIREMLNGMLALQTQMLAGFAQDDLLTGSFSTMFAGVSPDFSRSVYSMLRIIHRSAVMPLAYVVMCISFLFHFCKVFYEASSHQSGIDLFRLIMGFIILFFVKSIVDNSWELMILVYNAINELVRLTAGIAVNQYVPAMSGGRISDSFSNVGMLMWMAMPILIGTLVLWVCTMIAKVSLIVRVATIYIYAAFSPIPLSSAVTETGRQGAITFLKKFIAQVLAGAIMIVVFAMLNLCMQQMSVVYITLSQATQFSQMANAILGYMFSFVVIIALVLLIGKSGKLAQDLLGVG